MPLIDSFGRTIDYLRVSVTDRCNFRCIYCMPEEGAPIAPGADLLSAEELIRIISVASRLGMRKIRFTGGEPLVRKDLVQIIQCTAKLSGIEEISLTTNGFLLKPIVDKLTNAGLNRINISLDTLKHDRFVSIARRGSLAEVLDGIEASLAAGLHPVKLNCVVMRGWNEDEILDFAQLSLERKIDVRFIELMPINWSAGDDSPRSEAWNITSQPTITSTGNRLTLYANAELETFRQSFQSIDPTEVKGQLDANQMRRAFVSTDEILRAIEKRFGSMVPTEVLVNGPARSYQIPGATGTISFISQITNDMCKNCNRLRLTADGQLRPCLMADGEVDLRTHLRTGADDEQLAELFRITVLHKPAEHRLEDGLAPIGRNMSQLGG